MANLSQILDALFAWLEKHPRARYLFAWVCASAKAGAIIALLRYLLSRFRRLNYKTVLKKRYLRAQSQSLAQEPPQQTWALVTGGSSGIGRALATQLHELGFGVIVVSNDRAGNDEVVARLTAHTLAPPARAVYVDFDAVEGDSSTDYGAAIQDTLHRATDGLDVAIVVNCAGVMYAGEFQDASFENIRRSLNVNCYSYVLTTHALLKHLVQRAQRGQQSAIVNMGSYTPELLLPETTLYSATKAGVKQFSKNLQQQVRANNLSALHVLCMQPLGVNTTLLRHIADKHKRFGTISPEQCAQEVLKALAARDEFTIGAVSQQIQALALHAANALFPGALANVIRKVNRSGRVGGVD